MNGNLSVLTLEKTGVVVNLKMNKIGETTIASAITYLDSGYVYIGSQFGDSQLVHIAEQPYENGHYLRVIDQFTGLGPIIDFCVVDLEKQGQVCVKRVTFVRVFNAIPSSGSNRGVFWSIQGRIDTHYS
jgi:DNA damage-binding protein 1